MSSQHAFDKPNAYIACKDFLSDTSIIDRSLPNYSMNRFPFHVTFLIRFLLQ